MNKTLNRWQKRKNISDEFYTRREDIEAMLPEWDYSHVKDAFVRWRNL